MFLAPRAPFTIRITLLYLGSSAECAAFGITSPVPRRGGGGRSRARNAKVRAARAPTHPINQTPELKRSRPIVKAKAIAEQWRI